MNNLKIINDTLGHKKGDALLIKLAEFLNNAFEGNVIRIGGDEFIGFTTEKVV